MKAQKVLSGDRVLILADHRELKSGVVDHLKKHDCEVRARQLEVADYILSDRVGVERKSVPDFLASIFNQRMFKQLKSLSDSYKRPVLVIEGNPELLFLEREVNPNTVRGVLSSIAVDYAVPIIWTLDTRETAAQIHWMAKREQENKKRELQIRAKKKSNHISQDQEFLVSGLPGISNVRARKLLSHFKTPSRVFRASETELQKLEGFGEKYAKKIRKVLDEKYGKD